MLWPSKHLQDVFLITYCAVLTQLHTSPSSALDKTESAHVDHLFTTFPPTTRPSHTLITLNPETMAKNDLGSGRWGWGWHEFAQHRATQHWVCKKFNAGRRQNTSRDPEVICCRNIWGVPTSLTSHPITKPLRRPRSPQTNPHRPRLALWVIPLQSRSSLLAYIGWWARVWLLTHCRAVLIAP